MPSGRAATRPQGRPSARGLPAAAGGAAGGRKAAAAGDANGDDRHPTEEEEAMSAIPTVLRPVPIPEPAVLRRSPVAQAFLLLRVTFGVAPILFGLDKFAHVLTGDWERYLAPAFDDILPGSAHTGMHLVGIVEIAAGVVVLVAPRVGGLLVAAWLGGIVVDLLIVGGYGDIVLRDLGLLAGALALARLAGADAARDSEPASGSRASRGADPARATRPVSGADAAPATRPASGADAARPLRSAR
jgi:hypothetical protein